MILMIVSGERMMYFFVLFYCKALIKLSNRTSNLSRFHKNAFLGPESAGKQVLEEETTILF